MHGREASLLVSMEWKRAKFLSWDEYWSLAVGTWCLQQGLCRARGTVYSIEKLPGDIQRTIKLFRDIGEET